MYQYQIETTLIPIRRAYSSYDGSRDDIEEDLEYQIYATAQGQRWNYWIKFYRKVDAQAMIATLRKLRNNPDTNYNAAWVRA